MINRNKIDQNHCIVPNSVLGQHYSTVAEKLATKLPNISKDNIPSTSKTRHDKKLKRYQNYTLFLTT